MLVCLCIRAQRRRNDYKQLTDQTPATPGDNYQRTADVAPGGNGPLPYGRVYPSLNQGYGTAAHVARS